MVIHSASDLQLAQQIFDFLSLIDPNKVHTDAYGFINKAANIPPEDLAELEKCMSR
jgi:hypothetical protein